MPASQHQSPKSDIEISQAAKKRPILDVARERLGIAPENLEPYGHYKAKVSMDFIKSLQNKPNGKLILVSAITPTPAGEGKTTTTVGLTDALNYIGKKAMLCLREPSLGPSFGVKGGAAGGGYAQVVPMEDINLHFTGDFHAITSANNLLAALLDNHIYWGNALGIDERRVAWRRVLDMNDRALRSIVVLARRRRQRLSARGRFRHHGRLGSDGDLLPRPRSRRSQEAARQYRRRLYPRPQAGPRQRSQGARRHDGAAQGGAGAEPGADARRHAGLHPWRPVRQYRAWLQFGAGDDDRAEARRLRGHRSRLRRRSRRREVHRHQMPQGRHRADLRGAGRHHPRAQDARRRQEGGPQDREPQGARSRHEQSPAPCRERAEIRHRAGDLDQPLLRRHRRRDQAGRGDLQGARRRGADGRSLGDGRRGRGRCRARPSSRSPTAARAS